MYGRKSITYSALQTATGKKLEDSDTSRYIVIYCERDGGLAGTYAAWDRGGSQAGREARCTDRAGWAMWVGWRPGSRRGGYAPSFLVVGLAVVILFFAAASFDFFPFLFLFWWMIPFFLVPAIGLSARGIAGLVEARSRRPLDNERKERELLEALAQHGEITAAKAALETTLSVSEADRMLSGLAKDGHVEVRAREGRLVYAMWEHDRRVLTG
jgi:hypothetical protein